MRTFQRVVSLVVCACFPMTGCVNEAAERSPSSDVDDSAFGENGSAGVDEPNSEAEPVGVNVPISEDGPSGVSAELLLGARPLGAPDFDPTEKTSLRAVLQPTAIDQTLLDAFDESLRYDLLYPYYPTAHDGAYGGFVEDRSSTWALQQNGDKFVAAQARYTWTAAKAAQFYADNSTQAAEYLNSAAVGFAFLKRMWGYNYSGITGFGLMSDRDGTNLRVGDKAEFVAYGNAFAVYACAAYYAASGNQEALTYAINGYNFLDDYLHDSVYGGYYITPSNMSKDTNTNLHVIEALIELYQAMPAAHSLRPEVGNRVGEILGHFHDDAIHCETATDCFAYPIMARDWSANNNNVSFGHDVELAMLMVEALVVLGQEPSTSPYMTKIKNVVDFTYTNAGVRSDGGMYYTGTYNGGNVSINDSQLQWWPQAEGLGALCMMRMLEPNNTFYADTLSLVWDYIENQIIDPNNNGWVRQAGNYGEAKAWEWHCNYHNSRALMNCLSRLSEASCADANPADGICDHCVNGVMDESETDLNCGGACDPCADGDNCLINADCMSDYCNGGTCQQPPTPTCSDGIQNQGETGVDCGGPCPACICEAVVYDTNAMSFSTGGAVSDGYNIWSNGTGTVSHNFTAGDMIVTVNARGEQAGGGWPNMVVSVGSTTIGNLYVDNAAMQPYAFDYTAPGGVQQIKVEFTNDYYQSPDDRNLIIGSIQVACDGVPPAPTCFDGIQNQGETGVDCGGPCPACAINNAVWLEAEGGVLSGSPTFAVGNDTSASGGAYIQPTSDNSSSPGPNRATYVFNVSAGTYKVWGRVIAPNGTDDSFWVAMDGGSFVKWNSIPATSSWAWDDVHNSDSSDSVMNYTLTEGAHTLVFANREDGVKLDKLYITAKGDTPTGLGGDVNPCIPSNTCQSAAAECGAIDDGCGTPLNCGSCGAGEVCNGANQCEVVCVPDSCVSLGAECGTIADDGCGASLNCGSCGAGEICNGSNQCECVPDSCASLGAQCGTVGDGCGGTLNCGSCGAGESCNGANICEPDLFCGDGLCNNGETCSSCELDCDPCETCDDGIKNQNETGIDCGGVCPPCQPQGCTCPSGCNAVVNKTVAYTVDGIGNTCYFFNSLGAYINSWNTAQVNINGNNITNVYMGSWSYPGKIDGGYYIYYRGTVPWSHIEVK